MNALGNLWNEAWERRFPNNPLINHLRDHRVPFPHTAFFFFFLTPLQFTPGISNTSCIPRWMCQLFPMHLWPVLALPLASIQGDLDVFRTGSLHALTCTCRRTPIAHHESAWNKQGQLSAQESTRVVFLFY